MAVGPEVRAIVLSVAEEARAAAEALSADFAKTGHYAASFNVRSDTVTFAGHARAAGVLENTADYAAGVEWGNARDHKPHRVLGRVLDTLSR